MEVCVGGGSPLQRQVLGGPAYKNATGQGCQRDLMWLVNAPSAWLASPSVSFQFLPIK